jgi:hypothetical protein
VISLPDRKQPEFDLVSGWPDFAGPELGVSRVNFCLPDLAGNFHFCHEHMKISLLS